MDSESQWLAVGGSYEYHNTALNGCVFQQRLSSLRFSKLRVKLASEKMSSTMTLESCVHCKALSLSNSAKACMVLHWHNACHCIRPLARVALLRLVIRADHNCPDYAMRNPS